MSFDTRMTWRSRMAPGERGDDADDVVVGLAGRQAGGNGVVDRLGLQEQAAGRGVGRVALQRDALLDAVGRLADQFVEIAARLSRVASDFRHALLVVVEFLQRHHREEDVVLLEPEQARRVVHQHVGVEHEQLGNGRGAIAAPASRGLGRRSGGRVRASQQNRVPLGHVRAPSRRATRGGWCRCGRGRRCCARCRAPAFRTCSSS